MSFPTYPKYRASGMEWLNEVPTHWSVGSLRWLTRRYSGGTPDKTNLAYWENGTIPWLNSGAVNDRVVTEPSTYITADAFSSSSAKWIPEGALVMALAGQGKTKGMVARLAIRTTCNQSMAAIIAGAEVSGPFLFWWLDSNYQNIRNMAGGDLRDGLNLELLGNIQCPIPTLAEQVQIAAFLDRETAKIDALVAEQRRLIDLLKEKRQAVISRSVTRGLNSHAPMKPSGIAWLSEVPKHWQVRRLKSLVEEPLKYGANEAAELDDPTLPRFVRITDIDEGGNLRGDTFKSLPTEVAEPYLLREGDVLLARSGATVGKSFIYSRKWGTACFAGYLIRARLRDYQCRTKWLYYFCQTNAYWGYVIGSQIQATIQNVSAEKYANVYLPLPPADEQSLIVKFLDRETAKIDTLAAEAQRAMDLLQERRTALISAAVTGKIDVRGLVETEAA